jgi:hypothetical protein
MCRAVRQRYLAQSEVDFLGEEGDGAFEWWRGTVRTVRPYPFSLSLAT